MFHAPPNDEEAELEAVHVIQEVIARDGKVRDAFAARFFFKKDFLPNTNLRTGVGD